MISFKLIVTLILTGLVCILNGIKDSTYLLLPIYSNKYIFEKHIENKISFLLPIIGEILGAVFLGEIVLKKIQYGFINTMNLNFNELYICAVIILTITLIIYLISSFLPFPISLSHSMIGGLIGTGLFFKLDISTKNLISTTIIWTVTPIVSMIGGLFIYKIIVSFSLKSKKVLNRLKITGTIYILILYLFFLSIFLRRSKIGFYLILFFFSLLSLIFIQKILSMKYKPSSSLNENENIKNEFEKTEEIFSEISILILPNVFISHGANEVANSISLFSLLALLNFSNKVSINLNFYLLLIFSIILSLSIILTGSKKAKKLSNNICNIESSKIFTSYFSLSITSIIFSLSGYRISSIYTLTGSYIGIGYAKGFSIFNSKLLFTLLISWLITFGLSIILSYFLFYIIKYFGVLYG